MTFFAKLSTQQRTGAVILGCLALFAVAEMLLFSIDGNQQFLAQAFASPDWQAPLGRDQFGRNMFARLAGGFPSHCPLFALSPLRCLAYLPVSQPPGVVAGSTTC